MKPDLMAQLSRQQREAVESAGYRVVRWVAARAVLQARVAKGRIAGKLGEYLGYWMSQIIVDESDDGLWLSFDCSGGQITLVKSGADLANSPLERALLHLPALRAFWSQELRQQHFAALRKLVPQAWLLDAAAVPPGAVIEGLSAVSWEQVFQRTETGWDILERNGRKLAEWRLALAGRNSVLTHAPAAGAAKLSARYLRTEQGQVVLHSIEEASS